MKRWTVLLVLLAVATAGVFVLPGGADEKPEPRPPVKAELSPEEKREQEIIDRFVTVLEKNPRRGTALDRVYGYHVERGSLEELLKKYRDRTEKDAKDGVAWMVLGMVESQR